MKVYVDGAAVTDRLDGKPVQMDLGKHTVKFEYQGQTKEEEVIIGAGQKNRNVTVTFGAAAAARRRVRRLPGPARPRRRARSFPRSWSAASASSRSEASRSSGSAERATSAISRARASRTAPQSDVDKARTKLIIADISLGVGIVALGVATYMFLTRPKIDADVKTGHAAPSSRLASRLARRPA